MYGCVWQLLLNQNDWWTCLIYCTSVFFNRGSTEPKDPRILPIQIEKRELNNTCGHWTHFLGSWCVQNAFVVMALPQTLQYLAYSTTSDSLACCPLSKNLFPLSAFGLEFHEFPLDKFLATPMGSMSNQNCCKGFCFIKGWKTLCI